ncbi:LOW QUALITY PROTEIN: CMRF35-like molecule 5 [Ciconia maguari]
MRHSQGESWSPGEGEEATTFKKDIQGLQGVRSWKIRVFLVWTLFPGGWAVTGPAQVTAEQGGSLAVLGYELYTSTGGPGFLWFCFTYTAQTNGLEVKVTQDRVSVGDNQAAHSFTVMPGGVTPGDAGWYSCGVRKSLWFSLWHNTELMVSAAVTTTEGSNMSPLATNPLCPTGCGEPPVLSHLGITLLFLLSAKVPMALALACRATVRNRHRSHERENLQLLEVAGSTSP